MAKRNKTDYFREMILLAEECVNNLTTSENRTIKENIKSGALHEIRNNLEKDYFTPIEREDIFSICCHLYEIYEASTVLNAVCREKDFFEFSEKLTVMISMLKSLAENIIKIISAISKYPKTDEISQLFIDCESIYNELSKQLNNEANKAYNYTFSVIERCAVCCRTTVLHIQYVLIKNS